MASELAIYYTPMHFMWGVKSGATPEFPKQVRRGAVLKYEVR